MESCICTVLWDFNCNPYWPPVQEIWRCLLDATDKKLWHQIYIYISSFLGELFLAVVRPQGCTRMISYCLHSLECILHLWMYGKAEAYTLGYSSRLHKQAFHCLIIYLFILQENRSYVSVSCVWYPGDGGLPSTVFLIVTVWATGESHPLGHQVIQAIQCLLCGRDVPVLLARQQGVQGTRAFTRSERLQERTLTVHTYEFQ